MEVLVLAGYSGVGKTTAATVAVACGYVSVSVGDVVRQEYRSKGRQEPIGDFNTRKLREEGPAYFTRRATKIGQRQLDKQSVGLVVDGVHCPAAAGTLRSQFANVRVVYITAPLTERLQRLGSRDGEIDPSDLLRRDLREATYGLSTLSRPDGHDVYVENSSGTEAFEQRIEDICERG